MLVCIRFLGQLVVFIVIVLCHWSVQLAALDDVFAHNFVRFFCTIGSAYGTWIFEILFNVSSL